MRITPLDERFAVEVHDVDLSRVTAESGYREIRAAFEAHSLLLFRDQTLDDEGHLAFTALFGPIEDRTIGPKPPAPKVSPVSNLADDGLVASEADRQVQNLKANFLWHTDSTFLPVPALVNVLAARVVTTTGGETEFVSTRTAWRDLAPDLKSKARQAVLWHRYSHSRRKISKTLAEEEMFTHWRDQAWRAVWPNPVNGEEALYIASHAYAVDGMTEVEGTALIDALIECATRDEHVYSHRWRPGDVIVWDERATMHRGRPWPYEQERSLVSVVASAGTADGLESVRPGFFSNRSRTRRSPYGWGGTNSSANTA